MKYNDTVTLMEKFHRSSNILQLKPELLQTFIDLPQVQNKSQLSCPFHHRKGTDTF